MGMIVTKLPDGGVRYESDKAIVTIYERGRLINGGKLTDEGKKVFPEAAKKLWQEKQKLANERGA